MMDLDWPLSPDMHGTDPLSPIMCKLLGLGEGPGPKFSTS